MTHGLARHSPAQLLELPLMIALAAAAGLLLLWLIPLPLVMPAICMVSFANAVLLALWVYCSGTDRQADGITLWDVGGIFALLWIGAGILSKPEHVVQLFDRMMMTQ
jgi:hypothetical protein